MVRALRLSDLERIGLAVPASEDRTADPPFKTFLSGGPALRLWPTIEEVGEEECGCGGTCGGCGEKPGACGNERFALRAPQSALDIPPSQFTVPQRFPLDPLVERRGDRRYPTGVDVAKRGTTCNSVALRSAGDCAIVESEAYGSTPGSLPTAAEVAAFKASASGIRWSVELEDSVESAVCGLGAFWTSLEDFAWQAITFLCREANVIEYVACWWAGPPFAARLGALLRGELGTHITIQWSARSRLANFNALGHEDTATIEVSCCGTGIPGYIMSASPGGNEYTCGILHLAALIVHECFHLLGFRHYEEFDYGGVYFSAEMSSKCCDPANNTHFDLIGSLAWQAGLITPEGRALVEACDQNDTLSYEEEADDLDEAVWWPQCQGVAKKELGELQLMAYASAGVPCPWEYT